MSKIYAMIGKYCGLSLLVAGGISATGFAPLNLWPLTLICLALLMHLVARAETGRRAFLLGWLFGVGHFTIGNNWIATAFTFQSNMPAWLGWLAVPMLALYLAVYPGLATWSAWRIGKRVAAKDNLTHAKAGATLSFVLAFAGYWIITEWLRAWVFTGFAWNPLGAVLLSNEYLVSVSTVIGTYGLAGIVFFLAAAILFWWQHIFDFKKSIATKIGLTLMLLVLFLFSADYLALKSQDPNNVEAGKIPITITQPNISQIDKYEPGYEAINFSRLAQNSRPLNETPRLLLWPEAAIPWRLEEGYPFRYYQFQPGESAQGARAVLTRLMNPGDVLLTGLDRLEFDKDRQLVGARNSMMAVDSSGRILGYYDKAHLVPYGEYLALRWLLEPLGASRLVPGSIDFWPGPGPRTLDLPVGGKRVKVGMQICYEIIFSGQVTDRNDRPDFLFNPSNDAWFGSWGSPQFLAQARLRAIEEGLPAVRATPTGISAVIDADGRVLETLPSGKAGRIDTFLPMAKKATLFARYGNILPLGFAALLIALALLPLARRRLSR
ncbi:MAG: apolipoprotein N-acyltransferase [Sphingorhabdus sp.]